MAQTIRCLLINSTFQRTCRSSHDASSISHDGKRRRQCLWHSLYSKAILRKTITWPTESYLATKMTLQVSSSFSGRSSKGRWVLIRRGEGTESRLAKRPSAWVKKSYKELHNTCFDRVRSFVINLIPLIVDLPALRKKVIPWPVVSSSIHHHHREFKANKKSLLFVKNLIKTWAD